MTDYRKMADDHWPAEGCGCGYIMDEMVDEIERLRAALTEIADAPTYQLGASSLSETPIKSVGPVYVNFESVRQVARRALDGEA